MTNVNLFVHVLYPFIQHQDYDPEVDGSPFDLALVKLAEPVELVDEISPICLPDFKDQDYMDELCVITGWGLTKGHR